MAFSKGHALVIGVGTYQNASHLNVEMAVTDAQAVANVLQDPVTCGYPSGQVHFISNEAATKAGILQALDQLAAEVQPDDTVFLFYCGHGALGEDKAYYLISHDAQITNTVVRGTGVSGPELIDKLSKIKARRLLVMMNACYSGNLSPRSFAVDELKTTNPPEDTSNAILGSGQGRIMITASRQNQRSYIGSGAVSIFTQALVDGLGGAAENQNGYIGVYHIYEYLYEAVIASVKQQVHVVAQEPELTVVKGVGPFPVSLHRDAKSFGVFDTSEPAPQHSGVKPVDREEADKCFQTLIKQTGVIIFGPNSTVNNSGNIIGSVSGGTVIDARNSQGFLNQPQGPVNQNYGTINTGVGAYIGGNVDTGGGDFVGRDKITMTHGVSGSELTELFKPLMQAVHSAPPEVAQKVVELQNEVAKGKKADDTKLAELVQTLVKLAPDVVKLVTSIFASPLVGNIAGPITRFVISHL